MNTSSCPHCGALVEGSEPSFCCAGCEAADAIIRGAGLERYYTERTEPAPRPSGLDGGWDAIPVETGTDGLCRMGLTIDGMRCASCVWVTEHVLQGTEGVREAHVSYGSGRATIAWDPSVVSLSDVAGRVATLGYTPRVLGQEGRPDRDLLMRLGVAAFAAANVMMFAAARYAGWLGGMAPRFEALFGWLSLALATPVALWCAAPFFAGALAGLRARVLHMDVPIALAVTVLYVHGVLGTIRGSDTYLDSMTMLVALLLTGRVVEGRERRRAAEAAVTLAASLPATARRVRGSRIEVVAADALRPGDQVVVGPGDEIPADGTVESGDGLVRMAHLTGESAPLAVDQGDPVWAGTVLIDGGLGVRVTEPGDQTMVHRMADQVRAAADREARPTSLDRLAPWVTATTLAVAAAALVVWWLAVGLSSALPVMVSVLVVACPCALALSRPLCAAAGLGAAARRGVLVRSADAFLDLATVDQVGLDKTGTVTVGDLDIVSADDATLRVAAGLERFSPHPVAGAVLREAAARNIPLPVARGIVEEAGVGVSGVVDGRQWRLASAGAGRIALHDDRGGTSFLNLGDSVRSDSADGVRALEAVGLEVHLLSGDDEGVARAVARRTGISAAMGGMLPEAKVEWVTAREAEGRRVLFVGDGVNDAPALAAASVGVAMGGGVASTIMVSDAVLVGGSIRPLASAVLASRIAHRQIRISQTASLAYNVVAVGAAAAGWVNPLVAAVLMSVSSFLVLWGASRVEPRVRAAEKRVRGAHRPGRVHDSAPVAVAA